MVAPVPRGMFGALQVSDPAPHQCSKRAATRRASRRTSHVRGWDVLSLAAGAVSSGLPRYQGQAAARWPTASLDSSCALRDLQLREEQGEKWSGLLLCLSRDAAPRALPDARAVVAHKAGQPTAGSPSPAWPSPQLSTATVPVPSVAEMKDRSTTAEQAARSGAGPSRVLPTPRPR